MDWVSAKNDFMTRLEETQQQLDEADNVSNAWANLQSACERVRICGKSKSIPKLIIPKVPSMKEKQTKNVLFERRQNVIDLACKALEDLCVVHNQLEWTARASAWTGRLVWAFQKLERVLRKQEAFSIIHHIFDDNIKILLTPEPQYMIVVAITGEQIIVNPDPGCNNNKITSGGQSFTWSKWRNGFVQTSLSKRERRAESAPSFLSRRLRRAHARSRAPHLFVFHAWRWSHFLSSRKTIEDHVGKSTISLEQWVWNLSTSAGILDEVTKVAVGCDWLTDKRDFFRNKVLLDLGWPRVLVLEVAQFLKSERWWSSDSFEALRCLMH